MNKKVITAVLIFALLAIFLGVVFVFSSKTAPTTTNAPAVVPVVKKPSPSSDPAIVMLKKYYPDKLIVVEKNGTYKVIGLKTKETLTFKFENGKLIPLK